MTAPVRKRGFLLNLAAEGIAPVVAGCAKALAGGPIAGAVGVVGQAVERAINLFGQRIVQRWVDWMRGQPPGIQVTAIAELADLPADKARQEAIAVVDQATAPSLQHVTFALECCLDRSMVALLQHERHTLERLIAASQGKW